MSPAEQALELEAAWASARLPGTAVLMASGDYFEVTAQGSAQGRARMVKGPQPDRLTASEFVAIAADGSMSYREAFIRRVRNPQTALRPPVGQPRLRRYGRLAVVSWQEQPGVGGARALDGASAGHRQRLLGADRHDRRELT